MIRTEFGGSIMHTLNFAAFFSMHLVYWHKVIRCANSNSINIVTLSLRCRLNWDIVNKRFMTSDFREFMCYYSALTSEHKVLLFKAGDS